MTYPTDKSAKLAWPTTPETRRAERKRRRDAYLGLDYSRHELEVLGAFQATIEDEVIHRTRRIMGTGAFVARVDAAALSSALTVDLTDDALSRIESEVVPLAEAGSPEEQQAATDRRREARAAAMLDDAMRIWRRSKVDDKAPAWALALAVTGDLGFEIIDEGPLGARFVSHGGDRFDVLYDKHDDEIETAHISFTYTAADGVDGAVQAHTYERVLTAREARTTIDSGKRDPRPHPLGVCPFVHVQFDRLHDVSLGLHAAHGLEIAEAAINSIATQHIVIGTRTANPALAALGAIVPGAGDPSMVGKAYGVPETGDLKWLEPALSGLAALGEFGKHIQETLERQYPEFLFVDSGASSSGTALSYRAGALKLKLEPVQRRFWNAIARALAMCVALERGEAYRPEVHDVFVVTGGPVLPEDRSALVDLYVKLLDSDLVRFVDVIAVLQASGVLPSDRTAEEYAADVEREAGPRHEVAAQRVGRLLGGAQAGDEDDPPRSDAA